MLAAPRADSGSLFVSSDYRSNEENVTNRRGLAVGMSSPNRPSD